MLFSFVAEFFIRSSSSNIESTGYDTTANTLLFSVIMLAIKQDLQDRMIEEIDRIYEEAAREGRKELDYVEDLPKFRYTLAFMVSSQLNLLCLSFANRPSVTIV